jgi:hypothetical protein
LSDKALCNEVLLLVLPVVEKEVGCHPVATEAETFSPFQPASLELLFEPRLSGLESGGFNKPYNRSLLVCAGIGVKSQRVTGRPTKPGVIAWGTTPVSQARRDNYFTFIERRLFWEDLWRHLFRHRHGTSLKMGSFPERRAEQGWSRVPC